MASSTSINKDNFPNFNGGTSTGMMTSSMYLCVASLTYMLYNCATDEDGRAVENFCNTLFKCINYNLHEEMFCFNVIFNKYN